MPHIRLIAAGLFLGLTVSGCVVHVDDRRDGEDSAWAQREKDNRAAIEDLELGTAASDVRARLGSADFSEAFSSAGHDYRVLFYRTHRVDSDGETSRDETTPLVFRDGELVGWGDKAYRNLPDQ